VEVPANGRLVEADDPEALAGAMGEVLTAGRDSFTDACTATAVSNDLDVNTARLVEVLARAAWRQGEDRT
jgi:hypothetical protein